MKSLAEDGIQESGTHYPIPKHLLPAHSDLNYHVGDFPATEQIAAEEVSLPMFPELAEDRSGGPGRGRSAA